jgi:hypothetical protein
MTGQQEIYPASVKLSDRENHHRHCQHETESNDQLDRKPRGLIQFPKFGRYHACASKLRDRMFKSFRFGHPGSDELFHLFS